jgi:hypothetical protein
MALYALPMAALNAGGAFLEKKVALSVRTILFDRLNDKYTEAKLARFYRLALPDSDSQEGVTSAPQTLTTELSLLSDELVHHVGHLISPCMNIVYLSVVLRRSLGSAPLLCYLGYFCIATALIDFRPPTRAMLPCGIPSAGAMRSSESAAPSRKRRYWYNGSRSPELECTIAIASATRIDVRRETASAASAAASAAALRTGAAGAASKCVNFDHERCT